MRARLFAISVAIILGIGVTGGVYLVNELRTGMQDQIERQLLRQARATGEAMRGRRGERADALADRIASVTGFRVTLFDGEGHVVADSHLPVEHLESTDERRHPEVQRALAGQTARAHRYSTVLGADALHVAVPLDRRRIVRVAGSLAEVDRAVARLRTFIVVAGLLGLAVAVLMSTLASRLLFRTLRSLVETAHEIARGAPQRRVDVGGTGDLGGLAGSLNIVAEELENAVAALAEQRQRFQQVLEGMSEAVVVLDRDRRIDLLNPAAESLLGLDETALGRPLIEYLRVPALQDLVEDATGHASTEFQLPGRDVQIRATAARRRTDAGCILVLHDVTELRRLERIRRDFVANVSHELRTPVSVIRANAETLADGAMGDPVHGRRLVDGVHRNAGRLSRIIADLLDLSRLEAHQYQMKPETVSIEGAAHRAASSIADEAERLDVGIRIEIDDSISAHADPQALDHVLVNLLDNAVKYTGAGGDVVVAARAEDDTVRVEVRDTGPGIARHHRERIFERFYRVDPGRSREMGGTGLGLSIVKHLVETMGGAVGVAPNRPHGSIFWLTLPRAATPG